MFVRSGVVGREFTTNENELTAKSFRPSLEDLKRQEDGLRFRQSSLIDVEAFICTSDFKMHYCIYHFTLFSKTALEKRGLSNCPLFRLKITTSKSLTSALKITHYRGHLSVISRNSKFHECYRSCARPRGSRADLDTSALDHVNHLRSEKLDCNQSGRSVAAILRRIFPHNFVSSSHIGLKKPQYSAA